jgi:geranylgeranyl diphosphate synthase type II
MNQNNFIQTLSDNKKLIWPFIQKNLSQIKDFPDFCKLDKKYQDLVDFHFKMVTDYPNRQGKYLRPTLVMLTAQAMGVNPDLVIPTAAAMQLSEDWILGHDDIEDQSDTRRGSPAIQKLYGDHLALNAGDALHNLTWNILSQNYSIMNKIITQKINREFFTMINRTILGQTIEIKWIEDNRYDLNFDDVLLIAESKTCYYTIAGPMRLGAILASATDKQLNSIYKFGQALGKSFQIIDDLLDLTSDFAGQKNQIGNDIYEGKRTIMLIHLLNNISIQNKQKLLDILQKDRLQKTQKEVFWVINQMKEVGSLDYGKKTCRQIFG